MHGLKVYKNSKGIMSGYHFRKRHFDICSAVKRDVCLLLETAGVVFLVEVVAIISVTPI